VYTPPAMGNSSSHFSQDLRMFCVICNYQYTFDNQRKMERQPRRVIRDFDRLVKSGPANGIWIKQINPDSIDAFAVMLKGPVGPYEGALYFFTIEPWVSFNENENANGMTYPATPPRVLHCSPWSIRSHPNLYHSRDLAVQNKIGGGAKVCLSMLNTWAGPPWTPMLDFEMIFITVLSILDDDPLRNEPGYNTGNKDVCADYAKYVQYCVLRETMTKIIIPTLTGTVADGDRYVKLFENEIKAIWESSSASYINLMNTLEARYANEIISPSKAYYNNTSYVGFKYTFKDILDRFKQKPTI
jgi:ubiquitin-protein ligase